MQSTQIVWLQEKIKKDIYKAGGEYEKSWARD